MSYGASYLDLVRHDTHNHALSESLCALRERKKSLRSSAPSATLLQANR
jgi:hypothetical protein